MLTLTAPRPVQRSQITALLWSRRENEQARASLRQSVHELQETLRTAWSHIVMAERHSLSAGPARRHRGRDRRQSFRPRQETSC